MKIFKVTLKDGSSLYVWCKNRYKIQCEYGLIGKVKGIYFCSRLTRMKSTIKMVYKKNANILNIELHRTSHPNVFQLDIDAYSSLISTKNLMKCFKGINTLESYGIVTCTCRAGHNHNKL